MSFLTQSHQVFFGRPLCLIPSTSHVIQHLISHYHLFVQHVQTISTYSFRSSNWLVPIKKSRLRWFVHVERSKVDNTESRRWRTPVASTCNWWRRRRRREHDRRHTGRHWCWVDRRRGNVDAVFQWSTCRHPWCTRWRRRQTETQRSPCNSWLETEELNVQQSADIAEASPPTSRVENASGYTPPAWSKIFR